MFLGIQVANTRFFVVISVMSIISFQDLPKNKKNNSMLKKFSNFMACRAGATAGWNEGERHIFANETTRLRRMRYIESELGRENSILEIGCSSGFMLYHSLKMVLAVLALSHPVYLKKL
jgi:hypothetical protein